MDPILKEALEWAAREAWAAANRVRKLAGTELVTGDVEAYAHRLEGYARRLGCVVYDEHPAPEERETWARLIATREVDVEAIEDLCLLRCTVFDFAEAWVQTLDLQALGRVPKLLAARPDRIAVTTAIEMLTGPVPHYAGELAHRMYGRVLAAEVLRLRAQEMAEEGLAQEVQR